MAQLKASRSYHIVAVQNPNVYSRCWNVQVTEFRNQQAQAEIDVAAADIVEMCHEGNENVQYFYVCPREDFRCGMTRDITEI